MQQILQNLSWDKLPPELHSLAQRIIHGRVITISFAVGSRIEKKLSNYRKSGKLWSTIFFEIIGELIREEL